MDTVVKILNTVATLVPVLVGTGLLVKYLPWLRKLSNSLIPLLNALIVFFGAFGVDEAHAGLLGSIGGQFTFLGKAAAALVVSGMASWVYEKYLRGPLDALGLKKA